MIAVGVFIAFLLASLVDGQAGTIIRYATVDRPWSRTDGRDRGA